MRPYFQNLDIECWQHSRRLGETELALCFFQADAQACAPLLLALDELESAGAPARRTLTLKPCQRDRPCATIRLVLLPESADLRQMHIHCQGAVATIELAPSGLRQFRDAIVSWRDGDEDFGISPTWKRSRQQELGSKDLASGELWFWGPGYAGP